LSSGLPPAGIAVVRVSGPRAGNALLALAGRLPVPRVATLCRFRAADEFLDDGLALWFPGPKSVTGEDLAELHLHGGRAVVAAVLAALGDIEGLRPATAGEFTRRAFENGRIDLAEAEGLADLLAAETESQRQSALALAEGALGKRVADWQKRLLIISASVEAELDFSDEGDVPSADDSGIEAEIAGLAEEMAALLASPPAERLRDGVRIVLAGPPNSGKSSLFNMLAGRHAAIVTDIAGTTRDLIEAPVVLGGVPLLLIDTAGLREDASDVVEGIGIALTGEAMQSADLILWLGAPLTSPIHRASSEHLPTIQIAPKADLGRAEEGLAVSVVTGLGVETLKEELVTRAKALLPKPGALALNRRHRAILGEVWAELSAATATRDSLITAEHLRTARGRLDALTGRAGVEDMLDALFGGFCIGK
jgi:tRNA modification GTPase